MIGRWVLRLAVATAFFVAAGCSHVSTSPNEEPLAAVSPVPAPSLPPWIERISPTGTAKPLAQIIVIFKEPLVPLAALEDPSKQAALAKFSIEPKLPGAFRFLTPRMVGFQADRAIPLATRVRVTVAAGLSDLAGHTLQSDVAWTFTTDPVTFAGIPGVNTPDMPKDATPSPSDLRPTLSLRSNTAVDLASLAAHSSLVAEKGGTSIALDASVVAPDASPPPQSQFDPSVFGAGYNLVPKQDLATGTHYRLQIEPGITPTRGNMPSTSAYDGQVWTYAQLALTTTEAVGAPDASGATGRFTNGTLQLDFNNPLVAASAGAVQVDPAPIDPSRLVSISDGDTTIGLNPMVLKPNTHYTVTVGTGLKDQFGQTLASPAHAEFTTGDIAGDFWAPSGTNVFPAGKDLQLDISGTNVPAGYTAAYHALQPEDLVFNDDAAHRDDGPSLLPDPSSWTHYPLAGARNVTTTVHVPLREQLGGATGTLAYGASAQTYTYLDDHGKRIPYVQSYSGIVQITNLAVYAQWFPNSGIVRVQHLSDGSPAKAGVALYTSHTDAKTRFAVKPCASGQTDATGTWMLDRAAMIACILESPDRSMAPSILAVARENADWTFVRVSDGSGYNYGVYPSWPGNTLTTRGTIYSDRSLYQPGETAWLTGAAYYLSNGSIVRDRGGVYAITLNGPNNEKIDLGSATADEFGTFSIKYVIPKKASLGYWTAEAKAANSNDFTGDFRVAEFRPPNFKTAVTLVPATVAAAGTSVDASAQSTYLFGAPVAGATAQWTATRSQTSFTPKGWDAYSFGRQWFWPEQSPSVPSDVLQATARTDASGRTTHPVPVATDLPYPMTYSVSLETTDSANLAVADTKTFTALPSTTLIGLQNDFVATAAQPMSASVIVTDPQGTPVPGKKVTVELQFASYPRATQIVEGGESPDVQVQYTTVAHADLTSTTAAQTVSLTPPKPGAYRLRANFTDGGTDATATDAQLFVAGAGNVDWGGSDPTVLQLKLDKTTYKPGDTANLLVESPFPDADVYVAVIRSGVLAQSIVHVHGAAPQVHFKVTPDMQPNAAVQALLVRRGAPLGSIDTAGLPALAKIGIAPFEVDTADRTLHVRVTPGIAKLAPGAAQSVAFAVQDANGKPARAELTAMIVNDAILQLSGYRPPKLSDIVFADQPIETRLGDSRQNVVLKPLAEPVEKGYGFGGGFLAGAAGTRVRMNFQPIAYYGTVRTSANGIATLNVKLPDDLTTWRVMVVASGTDLRFGNGEATFMTTKPLLANPVLPQFARPGDRFSAGVSITDTAGGTPVSVQGSLEGALTFASGDPHAVATTAPGTQGTFVLRFPMTAGAVAPARAGFVVRAGGASDAFAVPFELRTLPVDEGAVTAGTTATSVSIPLVIDPSVVPDAGGLDITLASSVLGDILAPAQHILDGTNATTFLPDVAARLDVAAGVTALNKRYGMSLGTLKPAAAAQAALAQLASLQHPDGGFGGWPNAKDSWPVFTAYAAEALGQASAAGITVDSAMRAGVQRYLSKALADPKSVVSWCTNATCKAAFRLNALYGLAALGDVRNSYLADIVAQANNFTTGDRIRLARYLLRFPQWSAQGGAMADKLGELVYRTGRAATLQQRWGWPGSLAGSQSEMLQLMIARKASGDELDGMVRTMLDLRRDGTWGCTVDTAEALDALVAYAALQPVPPNFTATATLGTIALLSHRFDGSRDPSITATTPMAKLPRGKHDLVLAKDGTGTLHYLAAYRYRLSGPQPGALSGLRVSREVRLSGKRHDPRVVRVGRTGHTSVVADWWSVRYRDHGSLRIIPSITS